MRKVLKISKIILLWNLITILLAFIDKKSDDIKSEKRIFVNTQNGMTENEIALQNESRQMFSL